MFYFRSCNFGFVFQSFAQDVLCGIHISVVMGSARWAIPFADTQIFGQWVLIATNRACLTRRVECIDLEQFAPVQLRLVCELAEELAPACSGIGLRESVIPQPPLGVQMF